MDALVFAAAHFSGAGTRPKTFAPLPARRNTAIQTGQRDDGWLVARTLGRTPTDKAAAGIYDRVVVPLTRKFEARREPPFGQSVLCVGRRPPEA